MRSSRNVVTVMGLALVWTLSCKGSQTAIKPDVGKDGGTTPGGARDAGTGKDATPAGTPGAAGTTGGAGRTGGAGSIGSGTAGTTGSGSAGTIDGGSAGTTGSGGAAGRSPSITRRIAVFGDYGGDTKDEAAVAALVSGWDPDAIITVGDNNYTAGTFDALDQNVG